MCTTFFETDQVSHTIASTAGCSFIILVQISEWRKWLEAIAKQAVYMLHFMHLQA